jgi:phosphoribosylformylglycinamidine synthase
LDTLKGSNTPYMLLGHVTQGKIIVDDTNFGMVSEYKEIYNNSLAEKLMK